MNNRERLEDTARIARRRSPKYIVSDKHRFAYLVVQKVACTSIKTALLPLFDFGVDGRGLVREDGSSEIHDLFAFSRYWVPKERFLRRLERARYEGYFKFAFVRNPWDRLLSCYLQKLGPGGRGLTRYDYGGIELCQGMTFAEFIEAVHEIPDDEADAHFRSQHAAVCGPGGTVMADFVGRFENLERDFALVAKRIGLGNSGTALPHLTRSGYDRQSYTGLYDDRLRKLVHKRFEKDIETFGYSF